MALLLQGCKSSIDQENKTVAATFPTMPETIKLSFAPLLLEDLETGNPRSDWQIVKELPFGQIGDQSAKLEVYEETIQGKFALKRINDVLEVSNQSFLMRDIRLSMINRWYARSYACFNAIFQGR